MLAGANMAIKGIYLKTFLFNLPPCLTEEGSSRSLIVGFLQIMSRVVRLEEQLGFFL